MMKSKCMLNKQEMKQIKKQKNGNKKRDVTTTVKLKED